MAENPDKSRFITYLRFKAVMKRLGLFQPPPQSIKITFKDLDLSAHRKGVRVPLAVLMKGLRAAKSELHSN